MQTDLTRRAALLGAVASTALVGAAAAATSITSVQTAGISPELAALIAAVEPRKEAVEKHERDVLDHPTFKAQSQAAVLRQVQDNNVLNDAWCDAIDAVALFPVTTAADLHGKLAFMVENEMGDGRDWLAELLADAARLAKMEA